MAKDDKPQVTQGVSTPRTASQPEQQSVHAQVEAAPKPAAAKEAITASEPQSQRKDLAGQLLIDYLVETGCPLKPLTDARAWLKDNPSANADKLYLHMEAHDDIDGVSLGTLERAGRWVYGDGHQVHRGAEQAPAEELAKLRGENEQLRRSLEQTSAQKRAYMLQRDIAQERANDATRKLQILRSKFDREDLINLGVEEPLAAATPGAMSGV